MQTDMTPRNDNSFGEIYDLGYRHYDGERLGRAHAIRTLILYSIKRGLGFKKKWTAKVIVFGLYMMALGPVLVISAINAFVPSEDVIFSYSDYFGFISLVMLIFAAGLGPEMLCDDRRENVLGLYFSRALTRADYLLSKITAMGFLLCTITILPAFLLFLANVFFADSPLRYFGNNIDDLGRIILFGVLASAYLGSMALAVSAYTTRKGIAGAAVVGGVFLGTAIANALFQAVRSDIRNLFAFVDPISMLEGTAAWVFGREPGNPILALDTFWYPIGMVVTTLIFGYLTYRRYLSDD